MYSHCDGGFGHRFVVLRVAYGKDGYGCVVILM